MKVKNTVKPYAEVVAMKRPVHKKPQKTNMFFRTLLKLVSLPDLVATRFKCRKVGMERLGKNEPALIFMNHSSFIDLEIASSVLYPRPFNIVATLDAFIGKEWLMRQIGCIPTKKFVSDIGLVRDMKYTIEKLHSSVVMYPEASYSFDGTNTVLPESLGGCIKLLGVPVVMIRTYGAFTRDPLYNGLQRRTVRVSAEMKYLLSPEQIKESSPEELGEILKREFTIDNFAWQRENEVRIKEVFRADYLHRALQRSALQGRGRDARQGHHTQVQRVRRGVRNG